ncbi:MAG: hypothetical protein WCJ33_00690 [Pseudomonadota bacterium]
MNNLMDNIKRNFDWAYLYNKFDKIKSDTLCYWIFIYLILICVIFRLFKNNLFNFSIVSIFVAATLYLMSANNTELMFVSLFFLALGIIYFFFLLLMWLPARLEYDENAEAKIKELERKNYLSEYEVEKIFKLKAATKESYQNKVKWIFGNDYILKEKKTKNINNEEN